MYIIRPAARQPAKPTHRVARIIAAGLFSLASILVGLADKLDTYGLAPWLDN